MVAYRVNASSSSLVVWHYSSNTEAIVYDHLIWPGAMRDSDSFQSYADNHPTDLNFTSNSLVRDQIESGIPLNGSFIISVGNNTCL